MANLHYSGSVFQTDDNNAAIFLGRARALAARGEFQVIQLEGPDMHALALLVGPGIAIAVEPDDYDEFARLAMAYRDQTTTDEGSITVIE